MAGKDPAMPFYVNDWLSSARVACMTLEQQGAYIRLLCFCWASQDAAIPDDDAQLAVLSGMGEGWLNGGCNLVGVCFQAHPNKPGFLTNKKLFELWQERLEWKRKSSIAGKKSAESRRKSAKGKGLRTRKVGSTVVQPPLQPKGNSSSSSSSSSSCTKTPVVPLEDSGQSRPRIRASQSGIFGINPEDLPDTSAIMRWLTINGHAIHRDPENHFAQREILACAEEAIAAGDKPGGLFVTLMKQLAAGKPPSLTTAAEDRAKVRHDEWLRLHCEPASPVVQGALELMLCGGPGDDAKKSLGSSEG